MKVPEEKCWKNLSQQYSCQGGWGGTQQLQHDSAAASCLLRHLKEFKVLASDHLAEKPANRDSSVFWLHCCCWVTPRWEPWSSNTAGSALIITLGPLPTLSAHCRWTLIFISQGLHPPPALHYSILGKNFHLLLARHFAETWLLPVN